MSYFSGLVLGIIQGLTEFLPVSSSGHLVLAGRFLGLGSPDLSFGVILHLGTVLSTLVMLSREVAWFIRGVFAPDTPKHRSQALRVMGFLILASVPATFAGIFLGETIDALFGAPLCSVAGLFVTGTVLLLGARRGGATGATVRRLPGDGCLFESLTSRRAFSMGLAQAVAIIPGISRSGMTITAGLASGTSREDAARFSFLMSLVAVCGAALLDLWGALSRGETMAMDGPAMLGLAASFASGVLALSLVFNTVRRGRFASFAYYCYLVGIISLILLSVNP